MKKFNILITTTTVAFMASGCVKPVEDTQTIYNDSTQPVVYEEAQPIVYNPSTTTVYEEVQPDGTVITTNRPVAGVTSYPDPYANGGANPVYNDPYTSQPAISDYPETTYPTTTAVSGSVGGIHLQIAALKDYYTAQEYKNRLSLAPGLSAYVQPSGDVNKVIVGGIPSVAEANRLKESRFPGAFIVQGGASSGGYTPVAEPNYDTSGTGYNVNNPYYLPSRVMVSGNSGFGVQIGAFSTQEKAQSTANNSRSGGYTATVKRIGQYYKVILTGFSSRTTAKTYASRVGGFVVEVY